jgi:hypothetical protein
MTGGSKASHGWTPPVPERSIEPLNDSQQDVYDALVALVDEALEQYDAGQAVDLERRYDELARKWG